MDKKYKPIPNTYRKAPSKFAFTTSAENDSRNHPDDDDDDDDDEDEGIPISPNGSVLMPSQNPYNMAERIKQANAQLTADNKNISKPTTTKVRFTEPTYVYIEEDDFVPDGSNKNTGSSDPESKPSKILLVTLPTPYSNESEEILTDDDCDDDLDLINNDFRRTTNFQQRSISEISESEEPIEECTLPPTEETLTSSLETVICQSETEESDLTESFTKSINLNTENELMNSVISNNKNLDTNESLENIDNLSERDVEIVEKCELKKEPTLSEKFRIRPNTAHTSKMQKSPLFATVNDLSTYKPPLKKKMSILKKINSVTETRPSTAPAKRACCKVGIMMKLPAYNGLRSEYGLSKEQLLEKEKMKYELSKALKIEKEKNYLEERQKQRDNEIKFKNWLIKKKKEAEAKTIRRLRQSNYCFRTTPAPTSHLDRMGVLRSKILKQENTYLLLDEIFKNARPQEQKTYRIYLGLRV